jgi:hypothetical protein
VLWEFNRFLPEKPCQTGTLAKNVIIDFHHVAVLAAIRVILPPAPSVLQEDNSDAWVYNAAASAARAASF